MNHLKKSLQGLALASLLALQSPAFAHGEAGADDVVRDAVAEVRRATAPFHDVEVARQAGYGQFLGCVAQPGHGAMGIHYLNGALAGDAVLDPLRPEALMYEPDRNGRLQLVGVEYIVFQDSWDAANPQPPVLFGHPFHLVRAPNRYGVPAFYELHLWLWKHNRNGLFNDWNPAVHCP